MIAYLVKENSANENSLKDCTFVEASITRQDRDTYLEVEDLDAGVYWLYVDFEWQQSTFDVYDDVIHTRAFDYNVNCYGVGEVEFGENLIEKNERVEVLSHILGAYCEFHHQE